MDDKDKKILEYLSEKDWASEGAVINETFKGLDISKEEYVGRLAKMQKKDYVRYERPFGNPAFIRITEQGRNALKSWWRKLDDYFERNALILLTLAIAVLTLVLTIPTGS